MSRRYSSEAADQPAATRPRGRPPLSAADLADRRGRIVDVAARLFFSNGFADTTLEAVGREAGFTKRTIYELIGDKNALIRAACAILRVQGPKFAFDIPIDGRSIHEILKDMAHQLIDHALNEELIALQRAVMIESDRSPEIVGEVITDGKKVLDRAIADIFTSLAERGMIRPADFIRAGGLFYDLAVGARGFRAAMGSPSEAATDADLEERVDLFVHGYLNRTGHRQSAPSR
jgi:TetR/AcrR family transcriptional repressor of mexJK operon